MNETARTDPIRLDRKLCHPHLNLDEGQLGATANLATTGWRTVLTEKLITSGAVLGSHLGEVHGQHHDRCVRVTSEAECIHWPEQHRQGLVLLRCHHGLHVPRRQVQQSVRPEDERR
jgi:hypothetical protein